MVLLYGEGEKPGPDPAETRRKYLEALFERTRRYSPNRSIEDMNRQIAEERAGWED